jgi:Tfp pilus assembly protein PilO
MEQKTIISIVCFIAIVGLVIFLVYPKYQDLVVSRKQLDQKNQELGLQQDYFSKINAAMEKLNSYQDRLEKINSALPEQAFLPELYNYFQKITSENGLILGSLDIGKAENSSTIVGAQDIAVSISAAGSYSSFKNFLSAIYKSARLIELETISFASGGGGGKGEKEIPPSFFDFNFKLKVHQYSSAPAASAIENTPLPEEEIMP